MSDWKRMPGKFRIPSENGGTLLQFRYRDGETPRRALVYLPRGYEEDGTFRCPTVYLMHGGGGSEDEFFGGTEGGSPLKAMLDRMIEDGLIRPLIVVTPTFCRPQEENNEAAKVHAGDAAALTGDFWRELNNSLIPAVDGSFRTLADRDHRAFGGFSMGAEATWSVLCRGGGSVRYYLPMSGDFWGVDVRGGMKRTAETCDCLIGGIRAQGLAPSDYEVFAATGVEDIAFGAMRPMVEELLRREPWFRDADSTPGGNLTWRVSPGWHAYEWCWDYIYQALPRFFPGEGPGELPVEEGV